MVTTEHPPHSAGLARLHAQIVTTLNDVTAEPLTEGHALLEITGRGAPGAEVSAIDAGNNNLRLYSNRFTILHPRIINFRLF